MFLTNFKHAISTLPSANNTRANEGTAPFMEHLNDEANVIGPAREFLTRVTNYALRKTNSPIHTADHNARILLSAFAMTRFPVEMLRTPEAPLQLMLLAKATTLLLTIGRVLHEHRADEDDTADDFLSTELAQLFLRSLGEYRAVWAEWWASETNALRARLLTAAAIVQSAADQLEEVPAILVGEE